MFDEDGVVFVVDSVDGGGQNNFWQTHCKGERDDGTCH